MSRGCACQRHGARIDCESFESMYPEILADDEKLILVAQDGAAIGRSLAAAGRQRP